MHAQGKKKFLTLAAAASFLASAFGIGTRQSLAAEELGHGETGKTSAPSTSEAIPEGTPLSRDNLDQLMKKKLDGHVLRDLIPQELERFIREYNWRWSKLIKGTEGDLKKTPVKKGVLESTSLFKGQARVNPATKRLENFTAGIPFLDISPDDPLGGYKVMYNAQKPSWMADSALGLMDGVRVDAKKGVEGQVGYTAGIFRYKGRQHKPWNIEGVDYNVVFMAFQKYPTDAKGVGMMIFLYPDGRFPDIYAYMRSTRRVRRLSSGAWSEPMAGSEMSFDEAMGGVAADASWYQNVKLLGKRYVLATLHGEPNPGYPFPGMIAEKKELQERYPRVDLKNPPHWVLVDAGEPVSTYLIEITPPKGFSWGKRLVYLGAHPHIPAHYWTFEYDKKGELWKVMVSAYCFVEDAEKEYGIAPHFYGGYDVQRAHGGFSQPDIPRWQPVWNQAGTELAKQFTPQNIPNLVE